MRSNSEIRVGDTIVWWTGPDGRAINPADPDATRSRGRVTVVHHHPTQDRVVAYSVAVTGSLGEFAMTVRPEHHPTAADSVPE